MLSWFKQLDELLRGQTTSPERLAEGKIELSLRRFLCLAVLLGAGYGFFMGWYALSAWYANPDSDPDRYWQILACMVKLPALFLLTLIVTFPSLYVFNALVGCRLTFAATLRLLVGAITVNVAVAASLGPILGFFTLSTTSYSFMVLLNVILLTVAGFVALAFLLHTLRRLAAPAIPPMPAHPPTLPARTEITTQEGEPSVDTQSEPPVPQRQPGPVEWLPTPVPEQAVGQSRTIFRVWVIIYGLVGAQMGWLLRPFIGSPNLPFEWFRDRQGNFFQAVVANLQNLLDIH